MKVKTYKAIDMQEALRLIKRDLGPQAVILSTRKVVDGKRAFGLLGRPMVEVTAALDGPGSPGSGEPLPEGVKGQEAGLKALESLKEELGELKREMAQVFEAARQPALELSSRLESELEELRWWTSKMVQHVRIRDSQVSTAPGNAMLLKLVRNGMRESHALQIVLRVEQELGQRILEEENFSPTVESLLSRLAKTQDPLIRDPSKGPAVLALIGPTGVGKTTTVAKIAARCALDGGKKVALVTNDTYRIAAVEQLRTYARIMGVPLEVVLEPGELPRVLDSHSDKDIILIDTAGRSPMDGSHMGELRDILCSDTRVKTLLLVSATTESSALERAVRRFISLRPVGLIGTKLDEAPHFGALFSVSLQMRLPFAFFTTGQRVPEDIRSATKQDMASWTLWGLPLFYPEAETLQAAG
ncbi:MAG: flagellar biosynthesis protein FlhF [bacterium]